MWFKLCLCMNEKMSGQILLNKIWRSLFSNEGNARKLNNYGHI